MFIHLFIYLILLFICMAQQHFFVSGITAVFFTIFMRFLYAIAALPLYFALSAVFRFAI